jgi:hypothetical protein
MAIYETAPKPSVIVDSNGDILLIDGDGKIAVTTVQDDSYNALNKSQSITDAVHQMGHEGFVHHTSGKILALADAGVYEFLLVVPAATYPHLNRVNFSVSSGDVDIVSFEAPTQTDEGSVLTSYNTNRNSANTPGMLVYTGPTITVDGTQIHTAWVPPTAAGVGQSKNDGVADVNAGEEWIIKPSTEYLIRLTNNAGAAIDFRYEFLWYELDYA